MSLNGLEDVKVLEAFEGAVAEPGGCRDEVELLDRGNGSIVEARNAIAKYEEPSPLYGFLRYRRRNVILKYMPENCSRLIQGNVRPVAALPAGFKGFLKASKRGKVDKSGVGSEHREEAATETFPTAATHLLEVPKEAEQQQPLPARPATSSGASVKSVAASISSSVHQLGKDGNKMTPEKARLMKAMKLREKKMKMKASNLTEASSTPGSQNSATVEEPNTHEVNTTVDERSKSDVDVDAGTEDKHHSPSMAPSDSGISVDPPTPKSVHTETRSYGTTSDSHPPSPTAASMSEIADSTKASSLSESTDETVQANKEAAADSTTMSAEQDNDEDDDNNEDNNNLSAHDEEHRSEAVIEDSDAAGAKLKPVEPGEPAPEGPEVTPEAPQAETLIIKEVVLEDATSTVISQSLSQESQQTAGPHPSSLQTTEPSESSRDRDADAGSGAEVVTSKQPTKLRTTDLDTPPDQDDSPKSVLGVPRSKFSTSSEPKSSTSSSSRSPTFSAPKLRSKFSTQDLQNVSGTIPSPPSLSISADTEVAKEGQPIKEQNKGERIQVDQGSLEVPPKSSRRQSTHAVAKKASQSSVLDPLLDDALMDELQSAEVQEARPMLVSKSPITPVFPGTNSADGTPKGNTHLVRTVSNPIRGPLLAPTDVSQSSARSVSAGGAAYLHNVTRQPSSAGLLKKGGVGSSISQRIKALEKLSSSDDGRPKTATPTSSFYTVKKGTIRETSDLPSLADRANSGTRGSHSPEESKDHSPETFEKKARGRAGSMASRLTMFEGHGLNLPASHGRPESIQVTARILRDHTEDLSTEPDPRRDPNDFGPVELKESPLIVDVRKSEPEPQSQDPATDPPKETIIERRMSRGLNGTPEDAEKQARRPSLGIVKDFIKDRRASVVNKSSDNLANMSPSSNKTSVRPPSSQSNYGNIARRMSTSSHRSLSHDRDSNLGSPSGVSDASGDDEKGSDKKSTNRASRFMRRLSSSFAAGRKNVTASISPTLKEEPADEAANLSTAQASPKVQSGMSAYMGDVNVQFPDNLLWKRRSMCLESSGWLVLSALQGAAVGGKDKIGIKRYHLSEFRTVYAPDVEVQELPNSVVLDLVEGSCLQIACESRNGQLNALRSLQDAHRSHSASSQ
ncbi:hypothetical protein SLS62_002602 [Diatrype stigma]|uniref:GPI-anchored cell surface glycoprotein n=1 Tax=Diatrype stigma TaxID=117547 RepID=A0AAN9YVH2_9PEZI